MGAGAAPATADAGDTHPTGGGIFLSGWILYYVSHSSCHELTFSLWHISHPYSIDLNLISPIVGDDVESAMVVHNVLRRRIRAGRKRR